jgi:hypothetical protein
MHFVEKGGGGTSAEVQQQIDEIKTMTTQLETGQEEYDIKLSSIEEKSMHLKQNKF